MHNTSQPMAHRHTTGERSPPPPPPPPTPNITEVSSLLRHWPIGLAISRPIDL